MRQKNPKNAQIIALNFIETIKMAELVYDLDTKGCKTHGHTQKLYDHL